MDHHVLDPYEQQLLKVFDSCDYDNRGSLDKNGLTQLCYTLQLEEQGTELISHLLQDPKNPRVTFTEFKDALLTLLGNVQNNRSHMNDANLSRDIDKGSPDREVSPKFVYGSKKYGRRSRPRNDENIALEEQNENMNYVNKTTYNVAVQRSNSQSDVTHSKKRKTNSKLKRCTSFPGNRDVEYPTLNENQFVANGLNNEQEFVCTEEMLRKAWDKLGVGKDGFLNQTELILVCDAIGLHKLAKGVLRQLSNKLELDYDRKISFQDLLEALQQDDAWSDVLNPSPPTNPVNESTNVKVSCVSDHSKTVQHIRLGPDGTGFISTDVIVEMWETVGISAPKLLLQDLGFSNTQIDVTDLALVLEKEIKSMNDTRSDFSNPHVAFLQAILTLYQCEIRCLKNILEQMHAEREKLKGDVSEANNRATLLAQEVDDNHARMERNTQNQVKLLEQRHSDILKEMTVQFSSEKEQIFQINLSLEEKIMCLENEEAKLKNDLFVAQKYSSTIEKENQVLTGQVTELRQIKDVLTEQVNILESEKLKCTELEREQLQIEPLLSKLSALQLENSQLRDRNDEMVSEIESLGCQVSAMRAKMSSTPTFNNLEQSMEENISFICDGIGLGSKRRSDDSPSKDLNVLGLDGGSPRLGKVRKCDKNKTTYLEVPFSSNESGFDTELEGVDVSLSFCTTYREEIAHMKAKVALLEQLLKQNSIPVPPEISDEISDTDDLKMRLGNRISELENIITIEFPSIRRPSDEKNDWGKNVPAQPDKALTDNCTETDDFGAIFEAKVQKYVEENRDLSVKCSELENCIELLRNEYERCEDYWATKLDDERQMFEQEQNQSSDKLNELINKMAEYEAQFASVQDETDNRLAPIEEKYNLEKQFTDLEQEFEEFRKHTQSRLVEKDKQISELESKLNQIKVDEKELVQTGVQVNTSQDLEQERLESKLSNLSNYVVESTNLFSSDTMPFGWSSKTNQSEPNSLDVSLVTAEVQRDYVNPAFVWSNVKQEPSDASLKKESTTSEFSMNIPWQNGHPQQQSLPSFPSTSTESASTITDNNSTPCRPKRTRKHDKCYKVQRLHKKEETLEKTSDKTDNKPLFCKWVGFQSAKSQEQPSVAIPISTVHTLNARLHHLEQRCRHLQMVLKQQHYHAEQMLQHCWQQHRGEKVELQYMLKNSQEKVDYQMRVCNEQLDRLARTDVLVKDLYVENSYLIASVQRLEKQCHLLAQCNSSSSV